MTEGEYTAAVRTAGEIVDRAKRGTVKHRLTAGITDTEIAAMARALLMADDMLMPMLRGADDPLEPHPDPMRK
jgi:hypothetical protein